VLALVVACGEPQPPEEPAFQECLGESVDDLDDGDIELAVRGGRDGRWFAFHDASATVFNPDPFRATLGGPQHSRYAARISGIAREHRQPAGMGFSFNSQGAFDARGFNGVRFWAKGEGRARLALTDHNTDTAGGRCEDCARPYGVDVPFDPEWRCFIVPFSRLEPGGVSAGSHQPFAAQALYRMIWTVPPSEQIFDLWVDRVELFRCE
jgi:hypothetical protein